MSTSDLLKMPFMLLTSSTNISKQRKLDCSDVHTRQEDSDHVLNESSSACCSNHKIGRSMNLGTCIHFFFFGLFV
ncbi:hypothetical protein I7I48_08197 [Histoplasma ohiense]|nr:hypothetical protein I7I48_08197 [Histoplasma ohiense (nom. inval.)]